LPVGRAQRCVHAHEDMEPKRDTATPNAKPMRSAATDTPAANLVASAVAAAAAAAAAAAPAEGVEEGDKALERDGDNPGVGVGVALGGTTAQGARPPPNSSAPAYRVAP